MKRIVFLSLSLTLAFGLIACSSSDSSSSQAPDLVFEKASNAVSSSMKVAGSNISRLGARGFSTPSDPKCGVSGAPLDSNGDQISESDASYAGSFFYCLIKQYSKGPDSLLGAMSLAKGITCMVKDSIQFTGEAVDLSGLTVDGTCFPDDFVAEAKSDHTSELSTAGTIKTSQMGSPLFGNKSAWDYSIEISVPNDDPTRVIDIKMLFKVSDTLAAVSALTKVNGHSNDAFAVYVNTDKGILRYESKNQRYLEAATVDNSTGWNRHNRVLVKGNLDANGNFTDVSDVQALHSDLYKHDPSPDTDSGIILSLLGNPTDGFFTHNLHLQGDVALFSDFASDVSGCVSGTCDGNSGIAISSTDDLDFVMSPTGPNFVSGADWFKDTGPLSFTSVTTADSQ